jgi:hypothetical protein
MNRPHPLRKRIEALQSKRIEALIATMSPDELRAVSEEAKAEWQKRHGTAFGRREKPKP